MRSFFQPANGAPWLSQVLTSIRAALGDIWDFPIRPWQVPTASLPTASNYTGGIAYDTTLSKVTYSNGSTWLTVVDTSGATFTGEVKATKFSVGSEAEQGYNPAFVAKRNISDFTLGSAHGFSDATVISGYTGASNAYNSFEARCQFTGSGNLLHWAGFQFNGTIGTSGTTTDLWGYFAAPIINTGTVTNSYGVEIMALRGTGAVGTAYGVLVRDLALGTTRYALKTEGASDLIKLAGKTEVANTFLVTGNATTPTSGAGPTINYNSAAFTGAGSGNIICADWAASTYKNLTIESLKTWFRISGADIASISATGIDLATGNLTLVNPLAVAQGGTGAITAAAARTNLGVTATGADTTYAFRANNLSDLASASTARTNLGLAAIAASGSASDLSTGTVPAGRMPALTGDATTVAGAVAVTFATVNSNVGSFGSATQVATFTANGKGLTTAAANVTITPAVGSITGLGTGVATALAVNVGSAGAFVTFNGAGGTPSSLTLTNATGLPLAGMANVATATVFYRKTAGTGAPEVQTLATLKTDLGLTGTNSGDQTITLTGDATGSGTGSFAVAVVKINGVALSGLATGILKNTTTTGAPSIAVAADFPTLNQNTTGSAAKWTTARAVDGQSLDGTADITVIAPGTHAATSKATPVDADELPLVDSAASNVLKKLTWANAKATLKTYLDTLYQVLNSNLTTIAGLTATTDNFIVSVGSAWASRTPSQVRTTLALVIGTNVQAWDADLDTLSSATTGAWTAFTPTVTASSGTFTSASASGTKAQFGKLIVFQMTITITTVGTASGTLQATLPTTAANIATFAGRENAVTGNMVQGNVSAASNVLSISKYDNTSIIAASAVVRISGFYESQ